MRGSLAILVWVSLSLAIGCPLHTDVMEPDDDHTGGTDDDDTGGTDDDDTSPDWPHVPPLEVDHPIPAFPDGPCADYQGIASLGDIWSTPRGDENLELLALSLEPDRLVASDGMYERVVRDVGAIRALDPDLADIAYRPYDDARSLIFQASDTVMEEMASGEYDAWDCPNLFYAATAIETHSFSVSVRFKGVYRMSRLVGEYEDMPSVEYVGRNGMMGDGPTICASFEGELVHYVFDDAWGDCPAGCIAHDYTHYTVDADGAVTLSGEWDNSGDDPAPEWVSVCDYDPARWG